MKIITVRDRVREVAAEWYKTYKDEIDGQHQGTTINGRTKIQIYYELRDLLPDVASVDDVTAIIGNGSWTRLTCSECRRDVEIVIEVGEEPDYESCTAWLCINCVRKADEAMGSYRGQ